MAVNAVTTCSRFPSVNDAILGARTTTTTGGVRRLAPDIPQPTTALPHGNEDVQPAEASNPAEGTQSQYITLGSRKRASGMVVYTD